MRVFIRFDDFVVDGEVLFMSFSNDHLTLNVRSSYTDVVVEEVDGCVSIEPRDFSKCSGVCLDD